MFSLRSQHSLSLPWHLLSTLVQLLGPEYGQEYHLATLQLTVAAQLPSVVSPLALQPRDKQIACASLWKWGPSGSCPGGNTEKLKCGDAEVWQPFLEAGRLAALVSTPHPSEENDCSCWDGLLHSAPLCLLWGLAECSREGLVVLAHWLCQEGSVSLLWLCLTR